MTKTERAVVITTLCVYVCHINGHAHLAFVRNCRQPEHPVGHKNAEQLASWQDGSMHMYITCA